MGANYQCSAHVRNARRYSCARQLYVGDIASYESCGPNLKLRPKYQL